MERNKTNREVETLQTELRRESYRYQLALRDGAVHSIVREVKKKIADLEAELKLASSRAIAPRP